MASIHTVMVGGVPREAYRNPRTGKTMLLGQAQPLPPIPHYQEKVDLLMQDPRLGHIIPGSWEAVHLSNHIRGTNHPKTDQGHTKVSVLCHVCSLGVRFPWQE